MFKQLRKHGYYRLDTEIDIIDTSTLSSLHNDEFELQSDIPFKMKDIRKEIKKAKDLERADDQKVDMKLKTQTNLFYKKVKKYFDLGLDKLSEKKSSKASSTSQTQSKSSKSQSSKSHDSLTSESSSSSEDSLESSFS